MSRPARFVAALTLGAVLALVAGILTVRYVVVDLPGLVAERAVRAAGDTAREVAAQVATAFHVQPRVIIHQRTVVEQRSEVLKMVALEETRTERQRLDDSWLHSTKTLEVEGDFVVRAGFDLTKPFVIAVDPASGELRITLPPAEIFGVELRDVRFLRDESGLWNQLTPEDRERAIRELRLRAGLAARESDLLARARESAEERLTKLLARPDRPVRFEPKP